MKRTFVNVVIVLSLLLCAAAAIEWMRGAFGGELVTVHDERSEGRTFTNTLVRVGSGRGVLSVEVRYGRTQPVGIPPGGSTTSARSWRRQPLENRTPHIQRATFVQRLGFGFGAERRRFVVTSIRRGTEQIHGFEFYVRLPFWAIVLCTGGSAWLLLLASRRARAKRVRQGLCRNCGYDLRATPGQCPECGERASEREDRG